MLFLSKSPKIATSVVSMALKPFTISNFNYISPSLVAYSDSCQELLVIRDYTKVTKIMLLFLLLLSFLYTDLAVGKKSTFIRVFNLKFVSCLNGNDDSEV